MPVKKFSIGDLSKRTGVKIPTIRYYEKVKLMVPPGRNAGNQRQYSPEGLARLLFIKHARQLGFSIEDIRDLVALSTSPQQSCEEAHQIIAAQLISVRQRVDKLQTLERELLRMAKLSDSGVVDKCRVIETLADHELCEHEH